VLVNTKLYIQVEELKWTWNTEKAEKNLEKHKVSFGLAALGDPFAMTVRNPYPDEERWTTLGAPSADGAIVLFVVHTLPADDEGEAGRIISARLATSQERRVYEEG
jgi:uncharacterized DUF497 family protein